MTGTQPTLEEFDAALTDQDVTQARVITAALLGGTLTMAVLTVVFAMSQGQGRTDGASDTSLINILSLVHVGVFLGCLLARGPVGAHRDHRRGHPG